MGDNYFDKNHTVQVFVSLPSVRCDVLLRRAERLYPGIPFRTHDEDTICRKGKKVVMSIYGYSIDPVDATHLACVVVTLGPKTFRASFTRKGKQILTLAIQAHLDRHTLDDDSRVELAGLLDQIKSRIDDEDE
mgnify:CR=1 FL=1